MSLCGAVAQAYTSQIAVLTLVALALGEDTISSRERRERIIDSLLQLPGTPPVSWESSSTVWARLLYR